MTTSLGSISSEDIRGGCVVHSGNGNIYFWTCGANTTFVRLYKMDGVTNVITTLITKNIVFDYISNPDNSHPQGSVSLSTSNRFLTFCLLKNTTSGDTWAFYFHFDVLTETLNMYTGELCPYPMLNTVKTIGIPMVDTSGYAAYAHQWIYRTMGTNYETVGVKRYYAPGIDDPTVVPPLLQIQEHRNYLCYWLIGQVGSNGSTLCVGGPNIGDNQDLVLMNSMIYRGIVSVNRGMTNRDYYGRATGLDCTNLAYFYSWSATGVTLLLYTDTKDGLLNSTTLTMNVADIGAEFGILGSLIGATIFNNGTEDCLALTTASGNTVRVYVISLLAGAANVNYGLIIERTAPQAVWTVFVNWRPNNQTVVAFIDEGSYYSVWEGVLDSSITMSGDVTAPLATATGLINEPKPYVSGNITAPLAIASGSMELIPKVSISSMCSFGYSVTGTTLDPEQLSYFITVNGITMPCTSITLRKGMDGQNVYKTVTVNISKEYQEILASNIGTTLEVVQKYKQYTTTIYSGVASDFVDYGSTIQIKSSVVGELITTPTIHTLTNVTYISGNKASVRIRGSIDTALNPRDIVVYDDITIPVTYIVIYISVTNLFMELY